MPSWITPRLLLGLVSVGLIVAGLARVVEIRGPNRPVGDWTQIEELADRDDLNVVFVLIDTLRSDRLSAYGYERETSPIFDALAGSGILFRNVLAQSTWTKASMASLWTSVYPSASGITRFNHGLPKAVESPAEILKREGLRTVGIWRNGWIAPNFGFGQGFDLYYKPRVRGELQLRQDNPSAFRLAGTDHDLTRSAMEFLRTAGRERFFLYLHYMDVHQYVYDDSADFGSSYSDIYDNAIHWVDANLGTLVAVLQQEELMERTLLVVASDHGEAFGEHGIEGHARDLYRETSHVPLLFALPFRLEEGIEVSTPVENVDIWPTVFDLMGMPPRQGTRGRSLVPLIEAAARGAENGDQVRPRFSHLDQTWGQRNAKPKPLVSVIDDGYRFFRQTVDGTEELYDVEADPYEQKDITDRHPEVVERLRGMVRAYLESEPGWGGPDDVALDDFELGQLRALGYVVPPDEEAEEEEEEGAGAGDAGAPGDDDGGPETE